MSKAKSNQLSFFNGYGSLTGEQVKEFVQHSFEDNLIYQNTQKLLQEIYIKFICDKNPDPKTKAMYDIVKENIEVTQELILKSFHKRISRLDLVAKEQWISIEPERTTGDKNPCLPGYEEYYILRDFDLLPEKLEDYPRYMNSDMAKELNQLGLLFENRDKAVVARSKMLEALKS